ncbi:hypothetical protein [uncultured Sunxiuqinia sp.]|uniref:hypothetical protein n=1 Tax=uncultured Sunxiuqinia sp. TaxID=1573825 RepID=UPI00260C8B2D|nr:hypothetical protein [uncultured Sunxiuqinia sp.]
MDRQAFLTLTTSSQWVLFLAIGLIIYSWIEKRQLFLQLGQGTFWVLALFALWVLSSGQLVVPELAPGDAVPAEVKARAFFAGLVVSGAVSVVAFVLGRMQSVWGKRVSILLVALGLGLFFMVYELQRIG